MPVNIGPFPNQKSTSRRTASRRLGERQEVYDQELTLSVLLSALPALENQPSVPWHSKQDEMGVVSLKKPPDLLEHGLVVHRLPSVKKNWIGLNGQKKEQRRARSAQERSPSQLFPGIKVEELLQGPRALAANLKRHKKDKKKLPILRLTPHC